MKRRVLLLRNRRRDIVQMRVGGLEKPAKISRRLPNALLIFDER